MPKSQPFVVRDSPISGRGAFASRRIRPGQCVVEYIGEKISEEESDRRYDDDTMAHAHTFLFTLTDDVVVDAAVNGNDARFINHSCDPNCESVIEGDHIYIYAIDNIQPGVELTYDYKLERAGRWKPEYAARYKCRCGERKCRGAILFKPKWPRKQKRRRTA